MVHSHTLHLPRGALLTWCAVCGAGEWARLFLRPGAGLTTPITLRETDDGVTHSLTYF